MQRHDARVMMSERSGRKGCCREGGKKEDSSTCRKDREPELQTQSMSTWRAVTGIIRTPEQVVHEQLC